VSLDEVCEGARVTKGALYHHFENKQDLFLGVYQQVEDDLAAAGSASAPAEGDLLEQLSAAGQTFLDACARSDIRQIIVDAPAVLGWENARACEERTALGQLEAGIEAAVEAGLVESSSPTLLAHLLFALFHEAAMVVATSPEPGKTRAKVSIELDRVLRGLRPR
jgi:AcrR family transcriptional regulator